MPWATRRLDSSARDASLSLPDVREQLSSALMMGDATVKHTGARTGTPNMGSTLTAALIVWPLLYVAHVGDSRCNLLRDGALIRLTTDHTLAQQFAEQSTGSTQQVPDAWHNILWNSLGGSNDLPRPQITKYQLELGDLVLLCSDGLTKHVSDPEITTILLRDGTNRTRCEQLIARANEAGGTDNITVVVASAH
jgi:PPM family protein phosphatase